MLYSPSPLPKMRRLLSVLQASSEEKLPLTVSKSRVKSASSGRHRVTESDRR